MTIDQLTNDYIEWLFDESPTAASFHGADGRDDRLPDLSAAGWARRNAAEDGWIRAVRGAGRRRPESPSSASTAT